LNKYNKHNAILVIIIIAVLSGTLIPIPPAFGEERGVENRRLESNTPAEVNAMPSPDITGPDGQKNRGRFYLLAIGIDKYKYWPKLETAVNDAKAIANILTERYNFLSQDTFLFIDEQATQKNILEKLRFLSLQLKEEDFLIVYYVGKALAWNLEFG